MTPVIVLEQRQRMTLILLRNVLIPVSPGLSSVVFS
jgi:hypothetical protein